MSDASPTAPSFPHGLGFKPTASKWGWFVVLGVVMILAGMFALGDVVAFTLISVVFIGAMLMVGGIFQIIHAMMTKGWSGFAFNVLMGLLYIIGGVLIMQEPVQGSVILTILIVISLLVGGIMRAVVAIRHREVPGWWLMLLGGLLSVAVAVMLYVSLPWSGLWVLGTLIAIELLIQGFTWVLFGFALRKLAIAHR
jgi:uncharacterized membrane protein HdeD (DUF308 family)